MRNQSPSKDMYNRKSKFENAATTMKKSLSAEGFSHIYYLIIGDAISGCLFLDEN